MKAWLKDSADLKKVRDFLGKSGQFLQKTVKKDIYFAKPHAKTFDFRLREMNGKYLVNQKQRKLIGDMEENEELEFEVSDQEAFLALVTKFGYVIFLEKTKHTEMYRLAGNLLAEIVEIPELGHFLEVEALCENSSEVEQSRKEIQQIFAELKLQENVETKQYTVLLQEARAGLFSHLKR